MLRACYLQNSTFALVVNGWHSLDSWFIRRGLHKSVINFAKLENTSVDRLKKIYIWILRMFSYSWILS